MGRRPAGAARGAGMGSADRAAGSFEVFERPIEYNIPMRGTFILILTTGVLLTAAICADASAVTVRETLDGDTLILDTGERVRLIGIDAPELGQDSDRNSRTAKFEKLKRSAVDLYAVEARFAADEWVRGQKLILKTDPVNEDSKHRDSYGRLLAYVCRESDDRCLAEDLLAGGHALVYRRFDFERKKDFLRLEKAAREDAKGLWKHRKAERKPAAKKSVTPSRSAAKSAGKN